MLILDKFKEGSTLTEVHQNHFLTAYMHEGEKVNTYMNAGYNKVSSVGTAPLLSTMEFVILLRMPVYVYV